MKTTHKVLASFVTLLAACLLHAADPKPAPRVLTLLDVETDDPGAYAMWIAKYNEVAKAKLGIDNYLRVYQSRFDARSIGQVRVATLAANVAELTKNSLALENDPAIREITEHMRGIRKRGARVLYQGIYTDGPSARNAHNYSTELNVTDEAAYVQALTQLRTIFDEVGLKDVKMSAYRTIAGRTNHTHRVTINTTSPERLAAFLDTMATNKKVADWLASTAKIRTVVSSFTAREITK